MEEFLLHFGDTGEPVLIVKYLLDEEALGLAGRLMFLEEGGREIVVFGWVLALEQDSRSGEVVDGSILRDGSPPFRRFRASGPLCVVKVCDVSIAFRHISNSSVRGA
jgi:hypothetical protein